MGEVLPDSEMQAVGEHLDQCSACKAYAQFLRREDQMLAGMVEQLEANMPQREASVIRALNNLRRRSTDSGTALLTGLAESAVLKRAAAVAAIVIVTVYFVITLNWVSEMNELYALGM
jgi:predicted anti-sigma-YlaC factor YlaD